MVKAVSGCGGGGSGFCEGSGEPLVTSVLFQSRVLRPLREVVPVSLRTIERLTWKRDLILGDLQSHCHHT